MKFDYVFKLLNQFIISNPKKGSKKPSAHKIMYKWVMNSDPHLEATVTRELGGRGLDQ